MATNTIFDEPGRDRELARALNVALHAWSSIPACARSSEGKEIALNFAGEIETVKRALALLGIDRSETLPYLGSAPASPTKRVISD